MDPALKASLKKINRQKFFRKVVRQRYLFFMSVPIVAWLILFAYVPLFGWSYAFLNFKPGIGLFKSKFVGFANFSRLFQTPMFYTALKNTVIMAALGLVFGTVLAIVFALLLNEVRSLKYKRVVQTISYLPHFVSWVVVAGIVVNFLSLSGILNQILIGLHILKDPVNFMANPNHFYAVITTAGVWKELGWSAIIYISAMAGIDRELYEAAGVDGAGRLTKMWHITLPGIRPTIIILLIMSIGGLINGGFESQLLLQNGMNKMTSTVLNLYALQFGVQSANFSYGTTIAIFISVCSFLLVFAANSIAKKISGEALF
ncbi:MAG: ABC transporter permease subunit [Defluviitaleaceae bacterium]|nr:ABC transporter permease subunit [Defluviitaleaceae bacterium]